MMAVFCGVAAVAGHTWSVYLSFKGGKAVATGAGVVFALNWMAGLVALAVWLVVFLVTRYVSLASITAAVAMAAAQAFTGWMIWEDKVPPVTVFCILAALLVLVRHRENIRRLLNGEEEKIRFSRAHETR